ncbi:hypothetical protein BC831DRAFT_454451 [Entophlyctis helioformis]|nr:hypothetical protein BC831DRAFT_454451 [Entophlyctis helioformis]
MMFGRGSAVPVGLSSTGMGDSSGGHGNGNSNGNSTGHGNGNASDSSLPFRRRTHGPMGTAKRPSSGGFSLAYTALVAFGALTIGLYIGMFVLSAALPKSLSTKSGAQGDASSGKSAAAHGAASTKIAVKKRPPPDLAGEAPAASDVDELKKAVQSQLATIEQLKLELARAGHPGYNDDKQADLYKDDKSPVFIWRTLPSSSVWCYGDSMANRMCRFRNLCYNPKQEDWFILRTNRSILHNVPEKIHYGLLESGTVKDHPYFSWTYTEATPFEPSLQDIPVRYEDMPHFMFKRLHPRNIMHNLHDDVLGMYYVLQEFMGRGNQRLRMPFALDGHRVMIIDPFEGTDSTRPFQYLSRHGLRFSTYLKQKGDEEVITCFRDAYVGNTKLTTWYQYGFHEPQGPIQGKDVNGLHIREVAEWFMRRLGVPLDADEDYMADKRKMSYGSIEGVTEESALADATAATELVARPNDGIVQHESPIIAILSRKANRLILNEDELAADLKKYYRLEVVFVRNEDHSFEEQVRFMRRARVVIGMHGSILVMIMFCRRGTVVVEMYPYAVPGDHYTPYKSLSHLPGMGLVYRAWEVCMECFCNKYEDKSVAHPDNHRLNGGIAHLPLEEQELVKNTPTVAQHKCCASPFWLYRIYQDTTVTPSEIISTIDDALLESRNLMASFRSRNWEYVPVKAAQVRKIKCLDVDNRPVGTLWASWEAPWNGAQIEKWNVVIENTGHEYLTLTSKPSIAVPNFAANTTVQFFVRPVLAGNVRGDWSRRGECVV